MFQNSLLQKQKRWGTGEQQFGINELLIKKDQQIHRLQVQLQQQQNKSDQIMKMLESYKSLKNQRQQSNQGLRGQITRRIKAEQQVKILKKKNEQLQNGINEYIIILQKQLKLKQMDKHKVIVPKEYIEQ